MLLFFSEIESDLEELESKVEASGDEDSEASGTEAPLGEIPRVFLQKILPYFCSVGQTCGRVTLYYEVSRFDTLKLFTFFKF